jgi:hypothetical protein
VNLLDEVRALRAQATNEARNIMAENPRNIPFEELRRISLELSESVHDSVGELIKINGRLMEQLAAVQSKLADVEIELAQTKTDLAHAAKAATNGAGKPRRTRAAKTS